MKTTQFDKVVSWLCGWLGVRVGEASHPGPPDGQQTKRKVDETDWSTHQQDSHLAQALLQVLHSFQQDKKESRQEGNPYKKGKGGPNPKPAGSKLARILLQTLQSALTQGWSDETVAQRLISKITRHGPQENFHGNSGHELSISSFEKGPSESKQALGELLYPKVFAVSPEHAGKVTGMFLEWPVTEIHRLLQSEALLKTKVQEALSCLDKNHVQVPAAKRKLGPQQFHQPAQTWADRAREGPPNNSKGKGKGKQPNDVGTPRFAVKILPSEWKDNPVVTTLPKIQKALSEGLELPGNLIVTRDNEIVKEASNIFSAFGCQDKKLTVAVVGAQATGPSVCVWWSQAKTQGGSPQRVQLKLVQIGRGPGPTLKPPAVTNIPKPVGDKLVTIRFLAPAFYRKYIPGVCQEDSPKTIIAAWAQMTGCQASSFTGGRWEIATHAHGKILIGHVKMTKVQADKCLPLSGRNALFVTQVPPEDGRKGVAWIPRNAAPLEEYFRQALTQAQTRKAPLVIRQGGGSDLGIVGVDPAEFSKHQIKMWELFNAPRHWTHDDVKEFVSQNSWTEAQVVNKIRRGSHQVWLFKAKAAPSQGDAQDTAWHYQNHDGSMYLSIGPVRPRTRKQPQVEQLVAPKKRWVDTHPAVPPVAVTQLDDINLDIMKSQEVENQDKDENLTDGRVRSPRRAGKGQKTEAKAESKQIDPDKAFLAQNPGWKFVDNQGSGDCAFRSIAYSLSVAQGKCLAGESLVREASRLRVLAVGQLTKHKDLYEPFWAVDSDETEAERAFLDAPQDFPEYVMAASNQGYYADNLLLSALADRLQTPIIVFAWSGERKSWERSVLAKNWKSEIAQNKGTKMAPVLLMQHNKHYRSLCAIDTSTQVPQAWLHKTEVKPRRFYRGGVKVASGSKAPSCKSSRLSLPESSRPDSKDVGSKVDLRVSSRLTIPRSSRPGGSVLSLPSVSDADLAPKSSAKSALCLPSSRKRAASPAVSAPSSKRSCRSVKVDSPHSLSDSSKVGLTVDAPVPGRACRSGPSASVSTPTVKQANAPEGQTLWWTCHFPGCSYQVWRLPGTHHHTARRWSHLRNTHKMPVKEIPAVPRGDVVSEAQKLRKKRTWTHMLQLIQRKGWVGNHVHPGTLNANGSALPFKCTKCHEVIKHFYNKVCSKANPPPRIHTTRAQRFVVWKTCWDKAVSLAKAEASKARPELRKQAVISKAHMEQQARTHKNVPGLQSSSVIQGFQCVEANPGPVWWKCPWCSFKVLQKTPSSTRSSQRSSHLWRIHGVHAQKLPTGDPISAPHRLKLCKQFYDKRWTLQHKHFLLRTWKGAHVIEAEPCFARPYNSKTGKTAHNIYHRCQNCELPVPRQCMPLRVCPAFSGKPTPLNQRKKIWKKCRTEATKDLASQSSCSKSRVSSSHHPLSFQAAGTSATRRGLRAQRIGEASHPGPASEPECGHHQLRMLSQNIRSWHTNGVNCLTQAAEQDISLVAFQETNISDISAPGVTNVCNRMGWQMLHVPAPTNSSHRGGVAICCREPLGMVQLQAHSSSTGQFLVAEVHGCQRSFLVISYYRHASDLEMVGLTEISCLLGSDNTKEWILAMDANANQETGPCFDLVTQVGGICRAVARHQKSSYPIDAIWSSQDLLVSDAQSDLPGHGDHSMAQVTWNMAVQKSGLQQFRFAHTCRLAGSLPNDIIVSWEQVAVSPSDWQHSLDSVSRAWNVWCSDVEKWFRANQCLDNHRPERPLGSTPKVQTSTHRLGTLQGIKERQLRRWIRRLQEAHKLSCSGHVLSPSLIRRLHKFPSPENEKAAIVHGSWGLALSLAQTRLQSLIKEESQKRLQKWLDQVQTHGGACKWVRQEAATSPVLLSEDGEVLTTKTKVLKALRNFWSHTFGCQDTITSWSQFAHVYQHFLPAPQTAPDLPEISGGDITKVAARMKDKSGGPDGVTPKMVTLLPEDAICRLAQLLMACEHQRCWPAPTRHWRIAFIPKSKANGCIAGVSAVRPICVGATLYRLWAAIRLQHLRPFLESLLIPEQGGTSGLGVDQLLLTMELQYPAEEWPFAAALDLQKAFDATNWQLCLGILRHAGLPATVLQLLEDQWKGHRRWLSFRGAVQSTPLDSAAGLPQGDPWSPISMSVLLAVAAKHVKSQESQAQTLLYLDDRTIVAKTWESLQNALTAWDLLSQTTRLRNNQSKQQILARTLDASIHLTLRNISCQTTAHILGVSMGPVPRGATVEEKARQSKVRHLARRIGILPISKLKKNALAVSILAPAAVWGVLFNGRGPTDAEASFYAMTWRGATQGFDHLGGHDCRHLTAALQYGHWSDLKFQAVQRFMTALHKWYHKNGGWHHSPSCVAALRKTVEKLNCSWVSDVHFSFHNGSWNINMPLGFIGQVQHLFRQAWRRAHFESWLTSDRRDADIARAAGITVSTELIDRLRSFCRNATADQAAVVCGGLSTAAHWMKDGPPLRDFCPDCHLPVCPSTDHVYWHCQQWQDYRFIPKPVRHSLLCRLGWTSNGPNESVISQMAIIRSYHSKAVKKRRLSGAAAEGPPSGGGGPGH